MFQVIRVIPYSAVQLFAYEIYKVNCQLCFMNFLYPQYAFWCLSYTFELTENIQGKGW